MKFKYSARTKTGEMQVGYVDAQSKDGALALLGNHELYVLSLEAGKEKRDGVGGHIRSKALMIFTRQLATMLEAKIPLSDSLKSLYVQTKNENLKEVIYVIATDIDSGLSLSQSLERHRGAFSEFYINLIRSAELTGRVEESMTFLADHLEKEALLIGKVRNALIYPAVVVGLFIVVAGILLGVVFPKIAPIFTESGVDLPLFTRIFLTMGNFVNRFWIAIVLGAVFGVIFLIQYARSSEGRAVFGQIGLSLPIVSNLLKKVYVARFSETISVLIKGGIPVAQAVEIASHTVGNPVYGEILHEAAESIRRGELLSQALEKNGKFFPIITIQMIALGEQTGKLEEMFERVSKFYTREVDALVDNLVELIQPLLMVVIGGLIGLMFASILLPIYNLFQVF
ncbi:MAG: hypothetical protein COU08_03810 [Candidatus Harrisonbacteria bacterium CG10_big_fil_rev_8_21_14_0_10_42_17]|uniref:Type II secretion system protein GspF domain-containing protein n=1 Tax=Candidatus Harrisonbacteria bacterium CG10_big_fil_rev_8_21_14_0_10_42_17 TaxID=1974584 RepID=A0A2M6WHB0_9BACT|nr:MAG: hypothetical protein COU08_03810 [Candidatus Harrisonbacteria bacterium CG10_big_fil_rev_8_21_14_0_10_42_17]